MNLILREQVDKVKLPGRVIQMVIGRNSRHSSEKMTMGFASYSAESGPMEPHHHAEEIVYIISAMKGWVCYGSGKNQLGPRIVLEPGMTLHFPELEYHVFGFDEGGHVDIIFFYGQVDHIRPEEILPK